MLGGDWWWQAGWQAGWLVLIVYLAMHPYLATGRVFRENRWLGWLAGWLAGYLVVLFYIGWGYKGV